MGSGVPVRLHVHLVAVRQAPAPVLIRRGYAVLGQACLARLAPAVPPREVEHTALVLDLVVLVWVAEDLLAVLGHVDNLNPAEVVVGGADALALRAKPII